MRIIYLDSLCYLYLSCFVVFHNHLQQANKVTGKFECFTTEFQGFKIPESLLENDAILYTTLNCLKRGQCALSGASRNNYW